VEDWNWETIFTDIRSIFNHCDIIGLKICLIRWKNAPQGLLRRSRSSKCDFRRKSAVLRFSAPIWGLRGHVRWSSSHWKERSGLPISVNWTFSLGVTAEGLQANIGWKSAISLQRGPVDPEFQVEGVAPPTETNRLNDISYGINIWTDLSSVLSQCTRLTDGQTKFSWRDCVCYCMQRRKNVNLWKQHLSV